MRAAAVAAAVADLAEEYAGRAKVRKVHAAENPALASRYGVRAMPTVLGFSSGHVCGQLQGARPKSEFVSLIERAGSLKSMWSTRSFGALAPIGVARDAGRCPTRRQRPRSLKSRVTAVRIWESTGPLVLETIWNSTGTTDGRRT